MDLGQILAILAALVAGVAVAKFGGMGADVTGSFIPKGGATLLPQITGGQVVNAAAQPVDLWTMFFVVLAIVAVFTMISMVFFISWSWRFNKDNKQSASDDAWKIQDKLNREIDQVLQDGSKDRETFRRTVAGQGEKELFQTVAQGQQALVGLTKQKP